jgi:hypothetical protein
MFVFLAASHAALDHEKAANVTIARLLIDQPTSTVPHWTSQTFVPYREEGYRNRLAENLRKAGLPG